LHYSLRHPRNIYATRHKATEADSTEAKVVRAEIKSEVKSPNDKSPNEKQLYTYRRLRWRTLCQHTLWWFVFSKYVTCCHLFRILKVPQAIMCNKYLLCIVL